MKTLKSGDSVLISEGCTHHRQCNDIGTVKIPALIRKITGKDIKFEFTQGHSYMEDLKKYKLIVHCGGCMITNAEIRHRLRVAKDMEIPFTNYGVLLAYLNGILGETLPEELL